CFTAILKNKEDVFTFYSFQIKARNKKTLDMTKAQLLEAPWLNEVGKSRIVTKHSDWMQRLSKAKELQQSPNLTISLNEFEAGWLLERLGRNITDVYDDLFEIFKRWYNKESETTQNQVWNESEYGKMTKKRFSEIFSFGLIPKASFAGRTRTIYEVNSDEMQNLINIFSNKYMQIALYSDKNPWLNWAGELAKELKKLII
ncbi:MAG: hypothetical protein HeimAB125_17220, partial [Candidatus Heimdallarchaeota archaeon AB_125]